MTDKIENALERNDMVISLAESEERFHQFFENAPYYCYMVSPEGVILDANRAALESLGYEKEELVGKPLPTIYAPESLPKMKKLLAKWNATGRLNDEEMVILSKGSERRTVLLRASAVKDADGKIIHSISVQKDITERRKTEKRLKEVLTIIDRSPSVAFTWRNSEGWPVEFVSENVTQLFGHSCEDFTSGQVAYDKVVHQDDLERVGAEVDTFSAKKGREEFAHEPYRIITKDGTVKWVDDWTFIVRDEKGNITHYKGIVTDVTKRKMAEEELEQYRRSLEARVSARTRELNDTIQRLEREIEERTRVQQELQRVHEELVRREKFSAVGRIASHVSHDIRNPLGAISNSVFYLERKLGDRDKKVAKHLELIRIQVERSTTIVSEINDFFKGRRSVSLECGDVNAVIREALGSVKAPTNIEVATDISLDLPLIMLDKQRMQRVFENIAKNAVQAIEGGGKLTVTSRLEGDSVEVTITDTGNGIPADALDRLFEPLYTTKERGIGMGLPIVKSIVDAHGGTIDVESEVGKGTTVTVGLPVRRTEGGE